MYSFNNLVLPLNLNKIGLILGVLCSFCAGPTLASEASAEFVSVKIEDPLPEDLTLEEMLLVDSKKPEELAAMVEEKKAEFRKRLQGCSRVQGKAPRPRKAGTCWVCGNEFEDLERHMRVHTDERPYECEVCGKKFKLTGDLNRHKGIHTGERPFKCNVCKKRFRLKKTLKAHMLVHTDERAFPCEKCGKRYKQKWGLAEHLQTHNPVKSLRCKHPGCNRTFDYRTSLKIHMKACPHGKGK